MATKRFLVGGPSNSGKSTYVLSVTDRLQGGMGRSARAVELDVWSGSHPAFRGEVPFEGRAKHFGLDWDWRTLLDKRLKEFNEAKEDVVFGDLPGAKIDEATEYMCRQAKADGAIVISRTLEGLKLWRDAFAGFGVVVVHECLSHRGRAPLILHDMNRIMDPRHADVAFLAERIVDDASDRAERERQEEERRFLEVFRQNFFRRSRTAHGRDENLDMPDKKPLLINGNALRAAAMRNGERLARDVLKTERPACWDASVLREHCERWFDIANAGIYGPDWYEEEFAALEADAEIVGRVRGTPVSVNPRYRFWTPQHTLMKVPPLLLEDQMSIFYARLAHLMDRAQDHFPSWGDTLEAMAYADLMTDGELRPWLDGCGRVATALVMWITRTLGVPLPLFAPNKEVHRMTYRDLDRHRLYLLECIRRAESECP